MKYAKYKETGISWLPEVPDGWEIRRVKYLLDQVVEPSKSHCKVGLENIESKTGKFVESKAEFEGDGVAFKKGDLLYGKLRPYLAKVWMATFEGNAVGDFIVLRPRVEFDSRFALYYMLSSSFTGICNAATYGAKMPRVSPSFVSSLPLPVPTKEEQVRISEYLDDKCSKVDRLVEAKTKQIELLKELRERVIADAVTKGIDGCKTFKPTNIPWLPEVPETWEVVRNKCFMVLTDEKVGDRKGQFPLLSLTKQGVIIRDISTGKGKFPKDYDTYLVVKPNNLVFCLFDIEETPRTVGLVRNIGMITGAYTNFEINTNMVLPEFVYYYYLFVDEGKRLSPYYTGLRKVVKTNTFLSLRFPLPPLSEQKRIVTYLGKKCAKIDALVAKIEDEVVKLKEYRERLVADVVTGQRKVVK